MEIERQPGFEDLVGRSARSIHEELVNDAGHAYLLGLGENGAIRGFAILRDIGNPMGSIYLKRIAIRDPGQGFGTALLDAVIDWAFSLGDCHRFHLDHFVTNTRAHRAYEKCGLRQEGILREAYRLPDGRFADLAVMAITRPEWALRRRREVSNAGVAAMSSLQRKLRASALGVIEEARQKLFAALGPDGVPDAEPDRIFELWSAMKVLHPHSYRASEVGRAQRSADDRVGDLLHSITADLDRRTAIDLVFCLSIAEPAGAVDWYERFAGTLDCDLEMAIDILDTLEGAESRVFQNDIAIAAKDQRWAVWITPDAVVRTRPGRS